MGQPQRLAALALAACILCNTHATAAPIDSRTISSFEGQAAAWIESTQSTKLFSLPRFDNLLAMYAARDGDTLTSERVPLLFENLGLKDEFVGQLAALYLANGLSEKGMALILDAARSKSKAAYLELMLNLMPRSTLTQRQRQQADTLYELLQRAQQPVSDYAIVRLAILRLVTNDPRGAATLLDRIPDNSPHRAWRDHLRANLLANDGKILEAAQLLRPLCLSLQTAVQVQQSACLTLGKLLASQTNFTDALEAFNAVSADAPVFAETFYESIWSSWEGREFSEALQSSRQWQQLFPFEERQHEVARLQALSLLQTKDYSAARAVYADLQTQLTLETRNVDYLSGYYRADYARLIMDEAVGVAPQPLSGSLRTSLESSPEYRLLRSAYDNLLSFDQLADDMQMRLHRLETYLKQNDLLLDPERMNQLQSGLVVLQLGLRLRAEWIAGPAGGNSALTTPPSLPAQLDALLQLQSDTAVELRQLTVRQNRIAEKLRLSPALFIGAKRGDFAQLSEANAEQTKTLRDLAQQQLLLQSELQATAATALHRQLLQDAVKQWIPNTVDPKRDDNKVWETIERLDTTLFKITRRLKELSNPAFVDKGPATAALRDIRTKLAALSTERGQAEKRFKSLANRLLPKLLDAQKRQLETLHTDISWGLINATHAHLAAQRERERTLTGEKFDTLGKLNQRFDTGYK